MRKINIPQFVTVIHKPEEKKRLKRKMSTLSKALFWKRTQQRRDQWERKWYLLVKKVLNSQFRKVAAKVTSTNYNSPDLVKYIDRKDIEEMMVQIYQTVGGSFARESFNDIKSIGTGLITKTDPEDEWLNNLRYYAQNKAGDRITSIAEGSRKQALKIIRERLDESIEDGEGAEAMARNIRKGLVEDGIAINQWRALRIARTEVMTASNIGSYMGAQASDVPLVKLWITTYDQRTRDTHRVMEEQNPKEMDEAFNVGGFPAEVPGDPDLPAEEVINCRCTIAYDVKDF